MALSVLRLGQRQARETGPRLRRCREPLSRAALATAYVPRLGREARAERAGATIAAHGMTTPVRTNGDAPKSERILPPAPSSSRRGKGAGGESASEVGMLPSALTPPEQCAKFSPFEHRRERREADMRDGVRPAPAFSGQKPVNNRHCATRPHSPPEPGGSNEPQQRRAAKLELRSLLARQSDTGVFALIRTPPPAPSKW